MALPSPSRSPSRCRAGLGHHIGGIDHLHCGHAGHVQRHRHGQANPDLSESGPLPSGVSFKAGTAGTATLAGTPADTAKGNYPVTFTATS